jgi:hypothetical protein
VTETAEPGFVDDVRRAVSVCRASPALPALTTLFAVAVAYSISSAPGHTVGALIGIVFLGWVGSERLWFLRAYNGRALSARTALRASMDYWPRLVCLTLLLGVITLPPTIPVIVVFYQSVESGGRVAHAHLPTWALAYSVAMSLLIDFALTFVTPALIYTDLHARRALGIGLRLLRQTWPHAAPYVLLPPLAVVILSRLTGERLGWVGALLLVLTHLLNLIAKGATASFYLRHASAAGPDGDLALLASPATARDRGREVASFDEGFGGPYGAAPSG